MHLFALNQILAKVATCGCCFNCPSTVAWQPTQRAVEHIQQLQRGRAWRQAPRAMTLHFLTRPLLSLSLYLLLPFLGLLPIDYRSGRVHNPNNRRTGGGRREWGENEGKWEGGSGREAIEKGWTQSLRMNGQGCKNRWGGRGRPRAVNTLTCSTIGLFKAHSRPLHSGPFHVCHCRLPSPNTVPFTTLLSWKDESLPRKRYFIMLSPLILLLFILFSSPSETLSNVSKVVEIDRLVPL